MGAAVGDHRRLAALGEEDGQRLAEQHRSLGAVPQILTRATGCQQRRNASDDLLAGRDSRGWSSDITAPHFRVSFVHGCLPR